MAATAAAERNLRAKLIFMLLGGIVRNSGIRTREACKSKARCFFIKIRGGDLTQDPGLPAAHRGTLAHRDPKPVPRSHVPGSPSPGCSQTRTPHRVGWGANRACAAAYASASAAASTAGFLFIPSGVCGRGGRGFCVFFFHLCQGVFQDVERHRGLLLAHHQRW